MEFPTTYVDSNGQEWYCETMGDYLYAIADDGCDLENDEHWEDDIDTWECPDCGIETDELSVHCCEGGEDDYEDYDLSY